MAAAELFPPALQCLVAPLQPAGFTLLDPRPGDFAGGANTRCAVQFSLANNSIQWELLFSDQHCLRPPDVVLHEDCDMPVQYNALQSVAQFDQSDGTGGVSAILCEIRQLLQQHEIQRAAQSPNQRLLFELQTISDWPGLEVYTERAQGRVNLCFPLVSATNQPVALLHFAFGVDTQQPPSTQLHWKSSQGAQFPPLPPLGREECIMEYVPRVQTSVTQFLAGLQMRTQQRSVLIGAAISKFGTPLERAVDRVSFQFSHHSGFSCICLFVVGESFPQVMPDIVLYSLHPTRSGKPFSQTYNSYPYSPRWPADELAERWRNFLNEIIPAFSVAAANAAFVPAPAYGAHAGGAL